jgi:hypothetical protein
MAMTDSCNSPQLVHKDSDSQTEQLASQSFPLHTESPSQQSANEGSIPTNDESEHENDGLATEISPPIVGEDSPASYDTTNSHEQSRADAADNANTSSSVPSRGREWRSWKISWWFNSLVLLINICLVAAITVLDQLSVHNNGVVNVPSDGAPAGMHSDAQSSFKVAHYRLNYAFFWTSLPSLVLNLYSLIWAAGAAASYVRQPFVELQRGSNVRRTVMLDYQSYPGFYNWTVAIRHRHYHIACAMFLSLVVSVVVVPLSAHLLVAAPAITNSSAAVQFGKIYNNSVVVREANLQPFIDIATAVHSYGSTPPAWMTTDYAFTPFTSKSRGSATNLSAITDAYSAHLDCQTLDSASYTASYDDQGVDNGVDRGSVTFHFVDRSCPVSLTQVLASDTTTYAFSWCFYCIDQALNRFGMLTGMYSATSLIRLTNISLVSCIPSYNRTTGLLTISSHDVPPLTTNYVSFLRYNTTRMQPDFSEDLEYGINEYTLFSPNTVSFVNAVGYTILSAASRAASLEGKSGMVSGTIQNATERIFKTIYAALVTSEILTPAPTTIIGSGAIVTPVNRLFVTRWVAMCLVVVYLLLLSSHVTLWLYVTKRQSILTEEPKGVFGYSLLLGRGQGDVPLLERIEAEATDAADEVATVVVTGVTKPMTKVMDVAEMVAKVREQQGTGETLAEALKKRFDIDGPRCAWDEETGTIVVQSLPQKPSRKKQSWLTRSTWSSLRSRLSKNK